ncbi:putative Histidine kinase [Candidatus Terasakiella magnetica]|uniref:histidine kinase n=1 Tax=Candidatus Terasakiella magnetica TaxID=1867952 RepID=A0A1C3RJ20_9PROT|nr:ATP-binding protein [Candidatus Terasakiella magnetica]SCA57260.1 putative Histidine kinase [Candidatus Terasakiella magnetica]
MSEQIDLIESIAELEHLRQRESQKVQEKDAQLQAVSKLLELFNEDEGQVNAILEAILSIFEANVVSLYQEHSDKGVTVRSTQAEFNEETFQPCEECAIYRKARSGRCVNIPDITKFSCEQSEHCKLLHSKEGALLISGITTQDVQYSLFVEREQGRVFSRSELGMFQSLIPILKQAISISAVRHEKNYLLQELRNAQKLEAVGHLAGGIAHEINTPSQYIGDNLHFIKEGEEDLRKVLDQVQELRTACVQQGVCQEEAQKLSDVIEDVDLEFLMEELPLAISQSISGIQQISKIVLAMKEFSHPGIKDKAPLDINRSLETTLTVSRNEWKNVAQVETDFDETIGSVSCLAAEINQVFLNLIVNAVHAIEDADMQERGKISLSTKRCEDHIEIRFKDNGSGIAPRHQNHIFTPFYTTKDVGRGTGQGLPMARDIVVNKHNGSLTFDTELGVGTTFIIQLPII